MSNWQKWASRPAYDGASERLLCVLFVSRNKDNRDVDGFVQRRESFLASVPVGDDPKDVLSERFDAFVRGGRPNEMCRLYVSVNARDNLMVRKGLLERLIFDDGISMAALPSVLCGIAAKRECAAERQWMFDFDPEDAAHAATDVERFMSDIARESGIPYSTITRRRTPHGYAVIVPHGFDTRRLLEKWPGIATLKRDDLVCIDWRRA